MRAFKRNLFIGYGISLLLLIITAVASYLSIDNLLGSARMVNHTNEVSRKVEGIISLLKDAETGQRGFLLTGNEIFLQPYNGAYDRANLLINNVKQLTADNPQQQVDCDLLKNVALMRLNYLSALVEDKRKGVAIPDSMLLKGKMFMDNARAIVNRMQDREQQLLLQRTDRMNRFAASTPALILIASLLSIVVTIISFIRVWNDFKKRLELQNALQKKDEEVSHRINVIEGVSNQISAGNYKIRVDDEGQDALSAIAGSLNKMAASLDVSFTSLSEKEWLQAGIASLNDLMIVEQDIPALSQKVLSFVVSYSNSQAGALYVMNSDGALELKSSYALSHDRLRSSIQPGEGLAGQAAKELRILETKGLDAQQYTISYITGEVKPRSVIAIPLLYNQQLKGVMELVSLDHYSENKRSFLQAVSFNTGIAINTAQSRRKVQELLEETTAQAEELQSQHTELENVNAELEAQAAKLQASEEELRVQQEELLQANQELEQRSRLLEEKNEMVLERNLEIQSKAEELAQSTRYKSEFLANMSHELRTPLNSILLLSRLLSENHKNNLDNEQIEYAQVIQNSGKGLLTLIDEILDLSKIESGKMELEYSDVPLSSLTSDLNALFAPLAKDKAIEFAIHADAGVPAYIEIDRLRLEQILRNLLSNALKFTKKGSVQLQIVTQDEAILFQVKDTGIGIPKDKQETVFEAFQQADGSTRRQYGGTGLGLSISRELARLLHGDILLESEPGKGSTFTLLVPVRKGVQLNNTKFKDAEPPAVEEQKPEPQIQAPDQRFVSNSIPPPVPDDRNSISHKDRSILIIEDDTAFARSLLDYTRSKGYKGIVSVRGDEGIELARQYRPTGILLDIQLPVKSGWEVMESLKADPVTRPIPVHIMSSHQARTKSISKGAIDFISKPVAFEKLGEMFQKIEEALSRHPKKVLIVEENSKHAEALSYFLQNYHVASEIRDSVAAGIRALSEDNIDCVILDMGLPSGSSYEALEEVKKTPGLENIPIIVFTGKSISQVEEARIKQYADSIVVKTAHSYQRILDEVSLFLHLVEENNQQEGTRPRYKQLGLLTEVLKDKTVLIADDDVRNIFSLTKSLETYGINVISAIDGQDAIKKLQDNKEVNLILMDMMMPQMDGYEATRRIREMFEYRSLPIIAVTAKAMTGDREKCIAAGASDYITKPVDVDQLISLLRVWLYQ